MGLTMSTYTFNLLVIWFMTVILYVTLYLEWLRKLINAFDGVPEKLKSMKVSKKN
jgi:ABC transport system ATP-binding/permease protein